MRRLALLCGLLAMSSVHAIDPWTTFRDPLVMADGTRVSDEAQVAGPSRRDHGVVRSERVRQFPALPPWDQCRVETRFDKEAFGGKGRLREVVIHFPPAGTPPVYLLMAVPKSDRPVPSFVGLNFQGNHAAPRIRMPAFAGVDPVTGRRRRRQPRHRGGPGDRREIVAL